jgi:hypothetical protein
MSQETMTAQQYRRMLAGEMPESELQQAVENLLQLHGWLYHHAGDSRRSSAGLPDIVAVRVRGDDARVLVAELKSKTGRLRPEQQEWVDLLQRVAARAGEAVEVHVWRPEHWQSGSIEEVLR